MFELPALSTLQGQALLVACGALLLLVGRRVFWLAVGAIGFLAGFTLASQALHLAPTGSGLFVALAAGLAGVILAFFIQRVALALAGFLIGGYVAFIFYGGQAAALGVEQAVVIVAAALVTAVLAGWLFKKSLPLLSALAGAFLIVFSLPVFADKPWRLALMLGLAAVGAAFQLRSGRKRRAEDEDD